MSNIKLHDKFFRPYISEQQIADAISALAKRMNKDLAGKKPIFIPVLNGSFLFAADLIRQLTMECELCFIKASSYSGMKSTGEVQMTIGLDIDIKGRTIVLIEDIIDTGNTLFHLQNSLATLEPAEMHLCTLLLKPDALEQDLQAKYIGMNIPDKFVVGYGLDYDELGRNLPSIYQLVD